MFEIVEHSAYVPVSREIWLLFEAAMRRNNDRLRQAMANNLWDNHPGEIDRWVDDGGPARE